MSPTHRTPEYTLLTTLRDGIDVPIDTLNDVALAKALSEGYAELDVSQDFAHITNAGYDRLDELEDK